MWRWWADPAKTLTGTAPTQLEGSHFRFENDIHPHRSVSPSEHVVCPHLPVRSYFEVFSLHLAFDFCENKSQHHELSARTGEGIRGALVHSVQRYDTVPAENINIVLPRDEQNDWVLCWSCLWWCQAVIRT